MNRLGQLWVWLRWPIALGILSYLIYANRGDLNKLVIRPIDRGAFALSVVLCLSAVLLTFTRWFLLVRALEFPFRYWDAIRLGFVGMLFNYIAPGSVGGDIFKAVFLVREQKQRSVAAVSTVFLDRVLGLLALFMLGAVTTLFRRSEVAETGALRLAGPLLWVGAIGGWLGLAFFMWPAVSRWGWVRAITTWRVVGKPWGDLLHAVELYRSKWRILLASIAISVLGHAGLIAGFYFGAVAVASAWIPDLATHYYFMPIAELFGVLVPLPGGVGALEGAIEWFYKQLAPADVMDAGATGLMAALVFRLVMLGISAVGGAYYLAAKTDLESALHDAESLETQAASAATADVPPSPTYSSRGIK